MTATEHVVEVETLPLWRYSQPKLVQTGAQVCQQRHEVVYEKSDGACTSSQKMTILSHRKASAEPDQMEYFARNHLKIMLQKSICEVVATSMVSFRVVRAGKGGGWGDVQVRTRSGVKHQFLKGEDLAT
jgi:hypothetical protein